MCQGFQFSIPHSLRFCSHRKLIMQILISTAGVMHCVYSEALPLETFGRLKICRVSHVEPTAEGLWTADLSPLDGPRLGPFDRRSAALDAEQTWLEANWPEPHRTQTCGPHPDRT